MTQIRRDVPQAEMALVNPEPFITREWLVTNGLGGYASGTISGVATRRYHGLLIAALPSPFGRTMMLNTLIETITLPDGTSFQLSGEERLSCSLQMRGICFLINFSLEMGLPVWRFGANELEIEKRIFMRYRQNTVQVSYTVKGSVPVKLDIRPALRFRPHNEPLSAALGTAYSVSFVEEFCEVSAGQGLPVLRMALPGENAFFTTDRITIEEFIYRIEESRGYEGRENLWSPGYFSLNVSPGQTIQMLATTETPDVARALSFEEALSAELNRRELLLGSAHPVARQGVGAELALSADEFVMTPVTRPRDAVRINARGDEIRSVIAGYHWFTDWGRDTMISLEGLTLLTGRYAEAGWILRTFGSYIRDGLIPNMFPEGKEEARYNTADATLWFFHAIGRYLEFTNDLPTLQFLLPRLIDIIDWHLRGTLFGIHIDPADGLLTQGTPDFPLTWMDAKVQGWVVTPRRGKAVEINALWYNALKLLEDWCRRLRRDRDAEQMARHAARSRESFNQRFWYEAGGYLYDIVDGERGDDSACRPNQVFAISLPYPVLDRERWAPVMKVVTERLLTPVGLRSLAPGHPQYKSTYFGDIRARDAAYHQGTVWPWLIGAYIDAWLKLHPDDTGGARRLLDGMVPYLNEACIGSVSEIFDAEPPFVPRGCIAQAWSVAELLRAWIKTSG